AHRRGSRTPAQCARVHLAHSANRTRHPALLPLGYRTRRADAAPDRGQSGLHQRRRGQGFAPCRLADTDLDEPRGGRRPHVETTLRARGPRVAARGSGNRGRIPAGERGRHGGRGAGRRRPELAAAGPVSRKAGTSAALAGTEVLLRADAPARKLPGEKLSPLEYAIAAARDELIRLQRPDGSWELELEAD